VIIDIYQPFEWQNANQLSFGPDGMFYISSGSGGIDRWKGQTLDDLLGAVLRIDVHSAHPYAIPDGNPFADGPGGDADEVWAYGFRNPWRFTFDGGKMWLTDVGAITWEELNIVEPGANYGWPVMEGHSCFTPPEWATPVPTCDATGLATPRFSYNHDTGDCAIIGGHVYHGALMPELDGYYISSDLCSGYIWAVDTQDDDSEPILLADTDLFPVSWSITNDGEIIVINYYNYLFHGDPGIYRLERLP
jgi:glucose/arabinose dehydrogenase